MKLTQNQYYGLRSELPHSLNPGSVYLCEDTREFFIYGESGTPSELKISNEITGVTQEDIDRTVLEATNALILGTVINVVSSYNQLPLADLAAGKFYFVDSEQGTKWLPGSLGGTYYPKGLYHSTGIVWSYVEQPYQANSTEVNLGVNDEKFVTPYTLNNYNKWATKANLSEVQLKLNGNGLLRMSGDVVYYDNSNYITGITSSNVTNALGFIPYNSTNPNNYINSVPAQTFASLTGKPNTISGYGINDFNSLGDARWSLTSHNHNFLSIINKPTTLNGYGITDAYPLLSNPSGFINSYNETDPVVKAVNGIVKSNGSLISAAIAGTDYVIPSGNVNSATTLAGLTASIATLNNQSGVNTGDNATNAQYSSLVTNSNHTGEVTGSSILTITTKAVSNTKLSDMPTKTYKGRTSASTGVPEDVSISVLKSDLSLNLVDNTSDVNKPVSSATQILINNKADISGQIFTGAISAINLSNTNTGDETNQSIKTKRPLKTVNGNSLEGSGNIEITSGGGGVVLISGEEVLNFGIEENLVLKTISNSLITNENVKSISFINKETSETSLDDFSLNGVNFTIENIINNTSFQIRGTSTENASGNYTIKYLIII